MNTKIAAFIAFMIVLGAAAIPAGAQEIAGKGGMGFSAGVVQFQGGEGWGDGSARLSGQFSFQYGVNNKLALQFEAGGGWNNNGPDDSVDTDKDILTVVFPVSAGLLYRTQWGEGNFYPHVGLGGAYYRMGVKDSHRHYAEAPDTGETLLWNAWGAYGKVGTDYFFSDAISMNFDLVGYMISFDEGDRFGYEDGDMDLSRYTFDSPNLIQFRFGVNYFFNLGSGDDAGDLQVDDEGEN